MKKNPTKMSDGYMYLVDFYSYEFCLTRIKTVRGYTDCRHADSGYPVLPLFIKPCIRDHVEVEFPEYHVTFVEAQIRANPHRLWS